MKEMSPLFSSRSAFQVPRDWKEAALIAYILPTAERSFCSLASPDIAEVRKRARAWKPLYLRGQPEYHYRPFAIIRLKEWKSQNKDPSHA